MHRFEPVDPVYPVARQADIDTASIMVNLLTMKPGDEAAFPAAWTADSLFMKCQAGFVSTQLNRAIGENPTNLNYAVFHDVAAWRSAFRTPEFQQRLNTPPAYVAARSHLFAKVAVPDLCKA
ncbi:antibiotic biosynthesis monooxygenase [Paraburkholderia sp. BL17N1]|uniref:antibiotic biosynthesis monooxygenase family protein n=1 Tax=Paraburkholderia sp. BL17N1 TaxID=1938798 RepID=UPI000EAEAF0F|nr:antibiotic biosynthesis monooxygenase [Paraburkholderia sp. BL17N1]RKR45185.1 antibiotic biosynthesis monooxygenase [Paraburkholderia sp. BL17N1]